MVSISLTYKNSEKVEEAYNFIKQVSEDGGRVLFVGTKNKHKSQLKRSRTSGQFYVNQRWLGGILTNYKTISKRIKRISEIEKWKKTVYSTFYLKRSC